MGRTLPTLAEQLNNERNALVNFRRALCKEDQLVFDDLWVGAHKHLMAANQANHILALESFMLCMLLEQHKEVMRLRREVDELRKSQV